MVIFLPGFLLLKGSGKCYLFIDTVDIVFYKGKKYV